MTKHKLLVISAISLPILLIVTGLVLVVANLGGDSRPAARPAIPLTRTPAGVTVAAIAPLRPIPSVLPTVDPQTQAIAVAQALATNFARHDYAAARAISPMTQDDASLAKQYQPVTKLIVVPVDITPIGPSLFRLRLGLVSQQSSQNTPSTVFYCVDWTVDAADGTVVQGKSASLKTVPAQVGATEFPAFVPTCHHAALT